MRFVSFELLAWNRKISHILEACNFWRVYTVEPGYNDIGLYGTSYITSDIM